MKSIATSSRDELQSKLVGGAALFLDKPTEDSDPAAEPTRYGMDSVYAISIISDIEEDLQVEADVAAARRRQTLSSPTDCLPRALRMMRRRPEGADGCIVVMCDSVALGRKTRTQIWGGSAWPDACRSALHPTRPGPQHLRAAARPFMMWLTANSPRCAMSGPGWSQSAAA